MGMTKFELKKRMFEMSGKPRIHIDEDTVFEKPIKVRDYEANNMKELYELLEGDVITFEKYEEFICLLEMGEIGIVKKRKKYKELYEETNRILYSVNKENRELCYLLNEIEKVTEDVKVMELIMKYKNPTYLHDKGENK